LPPRAAHHLFSFPPDLLLHRRAASLGDKLQMRPPVGAVSVQVCRSANSSFRSVGLSIVCPIHMPRITPQTPGFFFFHFTFSLLEGLLPGFSQGPRFIGQSHYEPDGQSLSLAIVSPLVQPEKVAHCFELEDNTLAYSPEFLFSSGAVAALLKLAGGDGFFPRETSTFEKRNWIVGVFYSSVLSCPRFPDTGGAAISLFFSHYLHLLSRRLGLFGEEDCIA